MGRDAGAGGDQRADFGDIHARLGGKRVGDRGEAGGFLRGERAGDAAFAGIVGGEREGPVAEAAVELAQVARGGEGGLFGIRALVGKVGREALGFRRLRHELEKAFRADGAARAGVEGALGFGEPDELGGNAFGDESGAELGEQ